MKKLLSVFLGASLLVAAGCSKTPSDQTSTQEDKKLTNIVLASDGSDTDVWRYIATLPATKDAGIKLDVKNMTDYVAMNKATAAGEIDVNAFQTYNYLSAYNSENKDKLVPIATTYIEPMGIYSTKYKKIDDIKNNAEIAIPNDTSNQARALSLLQSAGLIELKKDFDPIHGQLKDITSNPKHLQLKLIPMATAVRVMSDVDGIVLGNTLAMEGGLNVLKDALFYEPINQSTKLNINLLVTSEAKKDDPALQKLIPLYHSEEVKKFIADRFGGTKIDVNKPISYLTEK
ncbi:MetQ/NlpA family ABC transporter substrate-binding protein [Acinetobacter rathckeae]|uniref:MetQ/NlpA family ABC transporter substrate-binding protein n=1 Tax=Acinetobacter rathckeae TaxID=2605272 RepID=UPI0018A32D2D|nr:MetQ/NlpA family ABC transporter substrate-binding protein [Acinetobacter rathckeae]MBF7686960.1 NLPA lipoprotein [Acinetobacter rathckeae]MBF7694636.1 NLPA lipoprotein [Acinetobacter rathckeae]